MMLRDDLEAALDPAILCLAQGEDGLGRLCARSLADEDVVRFILDATVVRTRVDRRVTNISVLAVIGVRRDGQKVLLSIRSMGGESTAAWRQVLDDLDTHDLKRPAFVIIDGAPGWRQHWWRSGAMICRSSGARGPQAPKSPGARARASA